jgi:hypothetical protein
MMMHEDVPEEVAQKAYDTSKRCDKRRSAKSKNRRKPPQKTRKFVEEEAEDQDEEDSEDQDDDVDDGDDEDDGEEDEDPEEDGYCLD